jgi:hypothetical protein
VWNEITCCHCEDQKKWLIADTCYGRFVDGVLGLLDYSRG